MTTIRTFENINVQEGGIARTSFTPDGTIPTGIHKIKGTYNENDTYNEAVSELQNFIVNKPTVTNIGHYVGSTGETITISADVTATNEIINEGVVQFKIAGVIVGTGNVTNGQASFTYTVACANLSTLEAIYLGVDGKYAASNSYTRTIIVRNDTTVFVDDITIDVNQQVVLSGSANYMLNNVATPIANGTGEIYINNVKYGDITTDSQGEFTFTGNLTDYTPGIYTGRATITQTDTYNAGEYTFNILVRHTTTTTIAVTPASKGETISLTANVKDESNSIVTEGTVEFTIDGTTVTASVVNGVAITTYTVPSNATQPITYSAQFLRSANYSASSVATSQITIRKDVTITVEDKTVTIGDSVYLVAHIVDENDNPVTIGNVDFEILEAE